jgi:hypothetical protein
MGKKWGDFFYNFDVEGRLLRRFNFSLQLKKKKLKEGANNSQINTDT